MIRLAEFRYTAVVPDQISPASFAIVFILSALRDIPLVHTFIIMKQKFPEYRYRKDKAYRYLQSLHGMVGYCIIKSAVSNKKRFSSSVNGCNGQ